MGASPAVKSVHLRFGSVVLSGALACPLAAQSPSTAASVFFAGTRVSAADDRTHWGVSETYASGR